jgi:hypothetical protein
MHALNEGLPVDQVVVPFPGHDAGGNSHRIMEDVASTILAKVAVGSPTSRRDVCWPDRWWDGQLTPPPTSRSLGRMIEAAAPPEDRQITEWLQASPSEIRDWWCDSLAAATRGVRAGHPPAARVADLVSPFFVHAEYRRRLRVDLATAESYVADLCGRLADVVA